MTGKKTSHTERRKVDRFVCAAPAEVTEIATKKTSSMHMTDVSTDGCFLETLSSFDVGSRVRVRFGDSVTQFETDAKVVYVKPGIGIGMVFGKLKVNQRTS